jgi:enamine deaminase RidA (YjgF/YER057c/UK114 family)
VTGALDNLASAHRRGSGAWAYRDDRRQAPVAPGPGQSGVHRDRAGHRAPARSASIAVRRVSGPLADELFVQCRPGEGIRDAARQAEALYEALLDTLTAEGAGPEAIVSETVFLRGIRADCEVVRRARWRVLAASGFRACPAATTFIGQAPLDCAARLELSAVAMVPRTGGSSTDHVVSRTSVCSCSACTPGALARVIRLGDHTYLHAGNIYGSGRDAFEEAYDTFRVAEGLLAAAGMTFGNVLRTWIHVRDIDRDYAALNRARREFFRHCGIERRPASTGVQGSPFPEAHDFSLSLYAAMSPRPLDIAPMCTPLLNEAWSYGADFSRGLRVADANKVTLYVSGTASLDEAGRTVHVGHFEAQVDRMLHNIASLLARQGATFENIVSAITYLKHPTDVAVLRTMLRQRGFDGFPCTIVEAPLCRPELLCETEAVAVLPRATAGG